MRLQLLNQLNENSSKSSLTFGLEIEIFLGTRDAPTQIDDRLQLSQQAEAKFEEIPLRLQWAVDVDYSCIPGIEVKTPIMPAGTESERRRSIMQIIGDLDRISNAYEIHDLNPESCATHIHVGGASEATKRKFAELWVADLQKYMRYFLPPERYKTIQTTTYARPIKDMTEFYFDDLITTRKFVAVRFHSQYKTIEFRTLEATLDPARLSYMINLVLNLVEKTDRLYDLLRKKQLKARTLAKEVLPRRKERYGH